MAAKEKWEWSYEKLVMGGWIVGEAGNCTIGCSCDALHKHQKLLHWMHVMWIIYKSVFLETFE